MSNERKCCKIDCDKLAEYEIWSGWKPLPDGYTDSCLEHIPDLLDDEVRFEIIKIGPRHGK